MLNLGFSFFGLRTRASVAFADTEKGLLSDCPLGNTFF